MCNKNTLQGETLCWRCKRAGTSTCSWDRNLTPVPGWDAVAVRWRDKPGLYQITWHIKDCPLFIPEPDYYRRMARASSSAHGKTPGRPPKLDWRDPDMGTLFRHGWSDRAVAQRFGVSVKTAARYREKWEQLWEAEAAGTKKKGSTENER